MSIPCLVINRQQDTVRWERASTQLRKCGIAHERFEAVEGADLSTAELALAYPGQVAPWVFYRPMSRGEIGCYLSHLGCVRRIIDEGWERALILEDDFELEPGFVKFVASLLHLPKECDLLKLWTNIPPAAPLFRLPSGHQVGRLPRVPPLTIGALITARGATRLLSSALPIRRPIDLQLKHWWEQSLPVYGLDSNILRPLDALSSSIGDRKSIDRAPTVRLRRLAYKAFYSWSRLTAGKPSHE